MRTREIPAGAIAATRSVVPSFGHGLPPGFVGAVEQRPLLLPGKDAVGVEKAIAAPGGDFVGNRQPDRGIRPESPWHVVETAEPRTSSLVTGPPARRCGPVQEGHHLRPVTSPTGRRLVPPPRRSLRGSPPSRCVCRLHARPVHHRNGQSRGLLPRWSDPQAMHWSC